MKNLDILVVYKLFMNNTSVLNITFDARIKDGLIKRDAVYKPIMSAPNAYKIYNNIKWFQSDLINNEDLDEAMGTKLNKQGRQMVFLNTQQFNSYVKFMVGKKALSKKMQDDIAKPGGIIEKNIRYLLEIFFGSKSTLYLGDKEYTIQGYEWDRTFTPAGDGTPKKIKLRFLLSHGKDKGFMKSVEVSCAQKWDSIKDDYAFLTGFKSDPLKLKEYEEEPALSKEENAAAKKQWDEDNKAENDAITKAWETKNEQDKQAWKKKRALNEKDAPYTKMPQNIDPSSLPIAQPIPGSPLQATNVQGQAIQGQAYAPGQAIQGQAYAPGQVQGQGQVQAAQVRAQSAMNVEKIRAKEAQKERVAKAEEAEKDRVAKAAEAEKQRKADADEAEKERIAQEKKEIRSKQRSDAKTKREKNKSEVSAKNIRSDTRRKKQGGNKRTRKNRTKHLQDVESNDIIRNKNKNLYKFWLDLANTKHSVFIYSDNNYKIIRKNIREEQRLAEDNHNIIAILDSGPSFDAYRELYRKAKNKSIEEVITNYKKYFNEASSGKRLFC